MERRGDTALERRQQGGGRGLGPTWGAWWEVCGVERPPEGWVRGLVSAQGRGGRSPLSSQQ